MRLPKQSKNKGLYVDWKISVKSLSLFTQAFCMTWATICCGEPPSIVIEPDSQMAILHERVAFSCWANGSPPLQFQWKKNGALIPGATNDSLVIQQAGFGDEGNYSLRVTNKEGGIESRASKLNVRLARAAEVDCSWPFGAEINGIVRCLVPLPNGKVLVGGELTSIGGVRRDCLALLNQDGTLEPTFTNVLLRTTPLFWPSSGVHALALQQDGKIIVGGDFIFPSGQPAPGAVRLNFDGSLDSTFHDPAVPWVTHLLLQPDGKILVAGAGILKRILADGSDDPSWHNDFYASAGSDLIYSIGLQSSGRVIVGSYTGLHRFKVDGTLDPEFSATVDKEKVVVAVQADDRILVGGDGGQIDLLDIPIARLNPDGNLDSTFKIDAVEQAAVRTIAIQNDGRILLALEYGLSSFLRLNTDGSVEPGFLPQANGPEGLVRCIVPLDSGEMLIGGDFRLVNDLFHKGFARLQNDGRLVERFSEEPGWVDGDVNFIINQANGKIILGGRFANIGGQYAYGLSKLNHDGTTDRDFNGDLTPEIGWDEFGTIVTLASQEDGKVYVATRYYHEAQDYRYPYDRLTRLDTSGKHDLTFQAETLKGINAILPQPDRKVLVAGTFPKGLIRLNSTGSVDTVFMNGLAGLNSGAECLALQGNGKIVVGGGFQKVHDLSRPFLTRLNEDGTQDTSFLNALAGPNAAVNAIKLQLDGKIVVAGNFTAVNLDPCPSVARLEQDGSLDSQFQPSLSISNYDFKYIGIQSDGKIVLAGLTNAIRLSDNGALDAKFHVSAEGIHCMAVQPDDNVIFGGEFRTVHGIYAPRLARVWANDTAFIESIKRTSEGNVELALRLPSETTNQIEFTTNLYEQVWQQMPIPIVGSDTNGPILLHDTNSTLAEKMFYRIRGFH